MGQNLDKVLNIYTTVQSEKYKKSDMSASEIASVQAALYEKMKKAIKKEIRDEMTEKEIAVQKKRIKEALLQEKVKQIRSLILEGILLALAIGIIVNQITFIIDHFKGNSPILISIGVIIGLSAVILIYVLTKLLKTIAEYYSGGRE